ncbi:MAG: HAD family hydrolase [Prolixibacteraceae bacterium]|jgi:D-glycero-D-manno-heptose 1,7-bisphosphate phosphatase|nr:HAD family hydrolase [Prolixibacteraceae bacterium]
MIRAVFIDRDGVVLDNAHHYYIFREEDIKLVEGIGENLKRIQDKGYQLFMVTNQGGISKGLYTMDDVEKVHRKMKEILADNGVVITEIAVCPHHDKIEKCLCRKPQPLMIEKLIAKHRIDAARSYFIGDSESDMLAAERAGVKGIRIVSNQNVGDFIDEL